MPDNDSLAVLFMDNLVVCSTKFTGLSFYEFVSDQRLSNWDLRR